MFEASRMQIRTASPGDAARLADFARQAFSDAFAADNRPEDMALYLAQTFGPTQQRAELEDPSMRTMIGEIDGELVAYAQLRDAGAPACLAGHRTLELSRFYVGASWKGRGVAAPMMAAVAREAGERGADSLWLGVWEHNARAIAFYRKHGFERVGEQGFLLGTDPQTDWVMERRVPPAGQREA